jgi:L-threonylcarbamoyladenylate synthase
MGTRRVRISGIDFISKLIEWDDLLMEIIYKPTQDEIKKAAKALNDGHLVAFPTETVYGLGADATNEKAVSRIYTVKGRPTNHPLILHISDLNLLDTLAVDIPRYAIDLAHKFWPGPMTLILKKSCEVSNVVTGGQDYVGIRIPSHPIALALLREFEKLNGIGIAAPSANRFGCVSPTSTDAVLDELGEYLTESDVVLDGGRSFIGIESTIISCDGESPHILRSGALTLEMIKTVIGPINIENSNYNEIKSSGMLKVHYAPKAILTLNTQPRPGDGFIAMSSIKTPTGAVRLASPKTLEEYAREIYAALRIADTKKIKSISVVLPEPGGIADAIIDRLSKAASKASIKKEIKEID